MPTLEGFYLPTQGSSLFCKQHSYFTCHYNSSWQVWMSIGTAGSKFKFLGSCNQTVATLSIKDATLSTISSLIPAGANSVTPRKGWCSECLVIASWVFRILWLTLTAAKSKPCHITEEASGIFHFLNCKWFYKFCKQKTLALSTVKMTPSQASKFSNYCFSHTHWQGWNWVDLTRFSILVPFFGRCGKKGQENILDKVRVRDVEPCFLNTFFDHWLYLETLCETK